MPLTAALYKPENFDPHKKYPMMVYIYEKLTQNVNHYVEPRPSHTINISYYVSNGYLVLTPDIVYTTGYPGQSALKCVLPAVQAVVDRGIVDENAIGIQGHSWGGYQIAYMVTQTKRFKAVAAGAPVADMISAYDGIRWGTGLPRQFQYERTQSRIGGSIWQYPTRFIENSPIFWADRVADAGDDSAERCRRCGAVVPGHRVLPGAAPTGQGGVLLRLQRRAARPAPASRSEGLHHPPAAVLRSFPERRARRRIG